MPLASPSTLALLAAAAVTSHAAAAAMAPVRVIQARVQGDEPHWEPDHGTFVSAYGSTFAERYRAVFDTVNTASVEGALMYVQAEGINARTNADCERKHGMQFVVFYELHVLQPDAALAVYDSDASTVPEYSPFVAMDGGACSRAGTDFPEECKALYGAAANGVKVGPAVGASVRDADPRAPYPDTVWYSFPNSCVTKGWGEKDPACRSQNPGGLCAYGSQPDGVVCSFTYKTLGYIRIDDIVGITQLTSSVTGAPYANHTEFCQDKNGQFGGVEFAAADDNSASSVTAIPFWEQPFDADACRARASAVVEMYNNLTASAKNMVPLPSPAALSVENPPCYQNSKRCATAPFGCRRELFSQICRVCSKEEDGTMKIAALVTLALVAATADVCAEDPLARALQELQTTSADTSSSRSKQLSAVISKISGALHGWGNIGVPASDSAADGAAMEALQKLDKKGRLVSVGDDFD